LRFHRSVTTWSRSWCPIACAGLAVFDLLAPEVILPAITL
jgi:hypothetical protein